MDTLNEYTTKELLIEAYFNIIQDEYLDTNFTKEDLKMYNISSLIELLNELNEEVENNYNFQKRC